MQHFINIVLLLWNCTYARDVPSLHFDLDSDICNLFLTISLQNNYVNHHRNCIRDQEWYIHPWEVQFHKSKTIFRKLFKGTLFYILNIFVLMFFTNMKRLGTFTDKKLFIVSFHGCFKVTKSKICKKWVSY